MPKVKLSVRGMNCEHCVKHVSEALKKVPGVTDVSVSLREGTAEVELSPNAGERELTPKLLQAVEQAGYHADVLA